jgi:hypothetical protein
MTAADPSTYFEDAQPISDAARVLTKSVRAKQADDPHLWGSVKDACDMTRRSPG